MIEFAELSVGQNLPFSEIPNDENLVFTFLQEDIDQIIDMLGYPHGVYTGALVEVVNGDYKTAWLSMSKRAFDLKATFLLVKSSESMLSAEMLGF